MRDATPPVIRLAESEADYRAFGGLCRDYVGWARERYADMPWFVTEVFGHQALDAELDAVASKYGPPTGRTMLAFADEQVVAGGAYRTMTDGACELKRLFVGDRTRGKRMGRKLSEALIEKARRDGFSLMRLDTADRMVEAIALYEALGFHRVAPYLSYPERLMPHLIFMALSL